MRFIFAGARTVTADGGLGTDPIVRLVTTPFYSILLQAIAE